MAEAFEAELRITGIDESVQSLRILSQEMDTTTSSTEGAGFSFVEFKAQLDLTIAAVTRITGAVTQFAEEMDRQTSIMERFSGSVEEARARTNGLFTEMQLVIAQSRALQSGLRMTGDEFANVAVAANEFADATGTDNVQALDMLTQALTSGSGEALRRFGIHVEGVTGLANIQEAALQQLTTRFGGLEAKADSVGDALTVARNAMADFHDELVQTIGNSSALTDGITRLNEAVSSLTGNFGTLNDDVLSDAKALGVGLVATFNAVSSAVINSVGVIVNGIKLVGDVMTMDFTSLADHEEQLLRRFRALTETAENFRRDIAVGAAEAAAETPGQTAGAVAPPPSVEPRQRASRPEEDQDAFATLLAQNAQSEEEFLNGISEQMAAIGEIENEFLDAKLRELEISDKLLLNEKEQAAAADEKAEAVARFQARQQAGLETAQEFTGILIDAGSKAVKGEMSFGKALKLTLKEWLGNFAKREALLGASDLAMAIGKSFSNPAEAATLYISGAQHIALAAAAGGGAAAIPGGGGGGGGGGGSARPEPSQGGGGGGSGGGTVVININSPVPEDQIGAMYDSAKRASDARSGSGRGL